MRCGTSFSKIQLTTSIFIIAYLRAVNVSKRSGVTHQRFLVLISALSNPKADRGKKTRLVSTHKGAWSDAYYRTIATRCTGFRLPVTIIPTHPVP